MLVLAVLIAITPGDLNGFWHSEPDLDGGYESCYFFWEDTGAYAHIESPEDGVVFLGDYYMMDDELILEQYDAVLLDGTPFNVNLREISLRLAVPEGKPGRISLDGEYFYLLGDDPDLEILCLMPTFGMSESESDAFSTYD
jgi:hypothetical protein